MRKSIITAIVLLFIIFCGCFLMPGCQKVVHGYLSDRIFYQVNPFDVNQGQTIVSAALVTDGSTTPLHVEMLALKDENGKDVSADFTTPQTITTFSGEVTYSDSTEEALRAKLHDSLVAPFNIAELGGRLQFTAATAYVNFGTYNLDISVSNVRGSKELQNACTINILPASFFVLENEPYTYMLDTITQGRIYSTPEITAVRDLNASGPTVITIKWVDADGKVFNPAAGEVLTRDGLANFKNWDPYYDEILTDTASVFQYPDHVPVFPTFTVALVGTATQDGYWCYYKIPAKYIAEPGQEARTGFSFKFPNAAGSYNVTIKLVGVHKK